MGQRPSSTKGPFMQRKRFQPSFVFVLFTSMFFVAGCSGTASDAGKSSLSASKATEPASSGKAAYASGIATPTADSASNSIAVLNAALPAVKPAPPAAAAEPTDTRIGPGGAI